MKRLSIIFFATLILALACNSVYASPDKAVFMSPIVWRTDGQGDYTFQEACAITASTYELKTPYVTQGPVSTISANWIFTGAVTLEISATGEAKDYVPIVNGVPLELGKNRDSPLRGQSLFFPAGNKLKWRATLQPGSTLEEVKISYKDTYGVAGSFGTAELSGFMFRKQVYIKKGSDPFSDLFHYQIPVRVGESANAADADVTLKGVVQSNFADCRFTQADAETLLPYWLEDITGTAPNRTATFWVKMPHVPAKGLFIYLYYGNADAEDLSNGEAVFDFFDEFDEEVLDGNKWESVLNDDTSAVSPTRYGIRLDGAMIKTKAFEFTDGIIEYKANSTGGGAIVGVMRGREGSAEDQMAYSSKDTGSEHCVTVGENVKANDTKTIALDTYYNYQLDADRENITFRRYNSDKSRLEAEAKCRIQGGIAKGFIGLSTSSQGTGVYYERIFVRKLASFPAEVDIVKTMTSQEEVPNIPTFRGLEIAPNGNLILTDGKESGEYVSPLVHSPFKARVVVPSWMMDEGGISVDISAKEYALYKENCANAGYYYASKKDFTEGDALRWRARFEIARSEGRRTMDEGRKPSLKLFTLDFRPGGIRLVSPNGGERVLRGQAFAVMYDASDYGPDYGIKLEYSTDGGMNFTQITRAAKNTGRYAWVVPGIISDKAVIRISDSLNANIYDVSDNYFSITEEIPIEAEIEAGEEEEEEEIAEEALEGREGTELYELLIKIGDNISQDPEENEQACYKDGDIVMIKPAGHTWGAEERGKFLIVQAYLTLEEKEAFMEPEIVKGQMAKRRKHKIDIDKRQELLEARVEAMRGLLKNAPFVDIVEIEAKPETPASAIREEAAPAKPVPVSARVGEFLQRLRKPAAAEREQEKVRSSFRERLLRLRDTQRQGE